MPSRIYPFVQVEIPFELGAPEGRWMLREEGLAQVRQVIVIATAHGPSAAGPQPRGHGRARRSRIGGLMRPRSEEDDPSRPLAAPITRATIVAAQPLDGEAQARAWLDRLDPEQAASDAFAALNRLLARQRIAAADPYIHELAPTQALSLRAGFGAGEQVAQGRWLQARELHLRSPRRRWRGRRAAILHPQERLAHLLSSERPALLCEELALRARLDLDQGRLALAAGELDRALALALAELDGEVGVDLPRRLAELGELHAGVHELAAALLPTPTADRGEAAEAPSAEEVGADRAPQQAAETLAHALGRLEAALRARAAALASRR